MLSLDPRQVHVWRAGWGLTAVVLVVVVALGEWAAGDGLAWPSGSATAVVAVLAGLAAWKVPALAYERWRYQLAETRLELHRGLIVHTHSAIPYFRVQHIDITRSPMERALHLSQLVIRTAAASTDATIPGIAAAEAERLRDLILKRAGRDDAV